MALMKRSIKLPNLLSKSKNTVYSSKAKLSFATSYAKLSPARKAIVGVLGIGSAVGLAVGIALEKSVHAEVDYIHPPKLPWSHKGMFQSLDHASMRRGYQVYKQVCAACHSMNFLCYRNMVDVIFTEDEAKKEAEEVMVMDGPDDEGSMFERPGKLSDKFPNPYANDEAAKAANNGALPPDLSFIVNARHGGEDYIFALLTGYYEPPAGVTIADTQGYNPYFAGGAIGMTQQLYNEGIEYEDGTPATMAQQAKDVSTFLRWASEPEHDQRKRMGMKCLLIAAMMIVCCTYAKKHKWSIIKSQKLAFKPPKY